MSTPADNPAPLLVTPPALPGERWRHPWLLALALYLVLGLVLYAPSLHGPFIYDDYHVLGKDSPASHFGPFPWALRRLLPHLSLAANLAWHGQEPLGYHLGNLLLHVLASLAVASLLASALALTRPPTPPQKPSDEWRRAGLGGLLFLAHPLATQSVSYMAQRYTVLAGCLVLWTLAAWLAARQRQALGRPAGWLWVAASGLALGAFLSKEFAFCLPGVLLVADALLVAPGRAARRWLLPHLPILLLWGACALLYLPGFSPPADFTPQTHTGLAGVLPDWGMGTDFDRWRYFCTQLDLVHRVYLRLLWLPLGQSLDHAWYLRTGLGQPAVLVGLATLLAALGLAAWAWRRHPLLSLGVLVFYLTLAPTSSFIPNNEPVAEHRAYLAMLMLQLAWLAWSERRSWRLVLGVTLPWLLATSLLTWQRNQLWASEEAIWRAATETSPARSRPWLQLGDVYYKSKHPDRLLLAASNYAEFLQRNQTFPPAFLRLGVTLAELGRDADARETLTQGLRLAPGDLDLNLALLRLHERAGRHAEALREAHAWLARQPDSTDALLAVGGCALRQGDYEEAINAYRRAANRRPQQLEAWLGLAQAQSAAGQIPAALATLDDLRRQLPQAAPRVAYERGLIQAAANDDAAAIREFRAGLAQAPHLPHLHLALAQALARQGELLLAAEHAERAQVLGLPPPPELLRQLRAAQPEAPPPPP